MAQFLRPDSNVTQTSFTNGFAEIDEATASNTDFAYGANNTAATLEVGLSNPSGTPASGTCTVRYRVARTNAGTVDGTGNSCTVTCSVYQGTTLIQADTARTATGTWTEYSFTFSHGSVSDWNDLRLRFVTSASGGSPANRRGGAVSWAEVEVPDSAATGTASITLGALTASGTGTAAVAGTASITLGALTASGTGTAAISGTAGITLGNLTVSGTGERLATQGRVTWVELQAPAGSSNNRYGTASITLDALTAAGTGEVGRVGSANITLADLGVGTRTNLSAYSSTFASWGTLANVTIAADDIVAPDGTTTADKVTVNVSTTATLVRRDVVSVPVSGTYTFSIYTKKGSGDTQQFLLRNSTTATNFQQWAFNYNNPGTPPAGWSIEYHSDGWFRLIFTQTTGISAGDTLALYAGATGGTAYTAGQYWYLWGAQLETGAHATPLIQTTTTSASENMPGVGLGNVAVAGTASITLGTLTAAGVGDVDIAGTAAITLGALTVAGTGTVAVVGTATVTLDALTVSGTGAVGRVGTASITLDALTAAGTGIATATGTAAITLDWLTVAGVGDVDVAGTAAITLDALTASGTGTAAIAGTAAITLGALTAGGVGDVDVVGTAAVTLADLTVAGTGTVLSGLVGTASITLDALTVAGVGDVDVVGTAAITLGALTVVGTGEVGRVGTAAITLADLTTAGTGTVAVVGISSVTLADLTVAGTGSVTTTDIVGTAAITLDALTASGTGVATANGTASITLDTLTAAGTGAVGRVGTAAITLDTLTAAGTGNAKVHGSFGGDGHWSSVVFQAPFDGADGATTASDVSTNAHALTFHGEAQLDTEAPLRGSASLLLQGEEYVTAANSSAFDLGSGDFTIETLFRVRAENFFAYSEKHTGFSKTQITMYDAAVAAPDGSTTAMSATATGTGSTTRSISKLTRENSGYIFQRVPDRTYTMSAYLKSGTKTTVYFYVDGSNHVAFDLSGVSQTTTGTSYTNAAITDVGDGWRLCSVQVNRSTATSETLNLRTSTGAFSATAGEVLFYVWGTQFREGTSATPYLKTGRAGAGGQIDLVLLSTSNAGASQRGWSVGVQPVSFNYIEGTPDFDEQSYVSFNSSSDGTTANETFRDNYPGSGHVRVNHTHHIAVTRSGSTLRVFLDGVKRVEQTITGSINHPGAGLQIGRDSPDAIDLFPGWIDEVRITKGVARYVADFQPPHAPHATGTANLDPLVANAVGGSAIVGTAAITLDPLVANAVGDADIVGTAAITLDPLTVAGTGLVLSGVTGTAAITLDALTVAGTGAVGRVGTASITLDPLVANAVGDADVTGTASIALDALTVAGIGAASATGTASITLSALTASGTGLLGRTGTAAITLEPLTLSGLGEEISFYQQGVTDSLSVQESVSVAFLARSLSLYPEPNETLIVVEPLSLGAYALVEESTRNDSLVEEGGWNIEDKLYVIVEELPRGPGAEVEPEVETPDVDDPTPLGAFAHFDFSEGEYWLRGQETPLADILSDPSVVKADDQHPVRGTGIIIRDSEPIVEALGALRDTIISQDYTVVAEFYSDPVGPQPSVFTAAPGDPFYYGDGDPRNTPAVSISLYPWNSLYADGVAIEAYHAGGGVGAPYRYATVEAPAPVELDDFHKVAATITADHASISQKGSEVIRSDYPITVAELSRVYIGFNWPYQENTKPQTGYGFLMIKRLTFYPALQDGDLPQLSAR